MTDNRLQRAADPTTPGPELAEIAMTWRDPAAVVARRNPSLPASDLRRWLSHGSIDVWHNPALPMALLNLSVAEVGDGAAKAALSSVRLRCFPLPRLLFTLAQQWWREETSLRSRLMSLVQEVHLWGGPLHRLYVSTVAATVHGWAPHLRPTRARHLLRAADALQAWADSERPEPDPTPLRALASTARSWGMGYAECNVARALLDSVSQKEKSPVVWVDMGLIEPSRALVAKKLEAQVTATVLARLPHLPLGTPSDDDV